MEYGIQMYGMRQLCRKDLAGVLEKLSRLGLTLFEPCVVLDGESGSELWSVEEAQQNMPLLRRYGFTIPSCHVFISDWDAAPAQLQALSQSCGIGRFVVNCPGDVTVDTYTEFAEHCRVLGSALQGIGCELLLHNGRPEIAGQLDGITAYEWVLRRCGGVLFAQPDVGWLLAGGADPVPFLQRNADVIHSLHYKDMRTVDGGKTEAAIGRGEVDVALCARFAAQRNLPQIIDQDRGFDDIFRDVEYALTLVK